MATGAERGLLAFLSLGEIAWVDNPLTSPTPQSEPSSASQVSRSL